MQGSNVITGAQLTMLFLAGNDWLAVHVDRLNALNVFPVPDGDTGTNMSLTMQTAVSYLKQHEGDSSASAGQVAHNMAEGALMGARGNSGTILSQIWRGFADATKDEVLIDIPAFVRGLQRAADQAYEAVLEPVEGTILTVIKQMAVTGERVAGTTSEFRLLLAAMVAEATKALHSTAHLLPSLRRAGVVDAGGLGLIFVFEGMLRHLQALPVVTPGQAYAGLSEHKLARSGTTHPAYDVQYLIQGHDLPLAEIRARISQMGTSALVVGDQALIKVHVHVDDPAVPLKYGDSQGCLTNVIVENMAEQVAAYSPEEYNVSGPTFAILAIADGIGQAVILSQLGADLVLNCSSNEQLSAETLDMALHNLAAEQIVILPNQGPAEAMAAELSRQISFKRVRVLPAMTIAGSVNVMLQANKATDFAANLERMYGALAQTNTIEICAGADQISSTGPVIKAYINGQLATSGADQDQVCLQALASLEIDQYEIITLFHGDDIQTSTAQALANQINKAYPTLEVEVVDGGQASSTYIISLE